MSYYIRRSQERIPMGTWPKLVAYGIKWILNKRLPVGVGIVLRGRGPRTSGSFRERSDLHISRAPRAALYLVRTTRKKEWHNEIPSEDVVVQSRHTFDPESHPLNIISPLGEGGSC